jgi:hypothetical protein
MAQTVTLTPGYVWTLGELITEDKLNQAANPTVELEGTISAASLADNSITLAKLIVGILSADTAGRSRMEDGYITLAKIEDGIFTADAAGRAKFADDFVNQALLADNSVGTAQIIDANVTLAKWSAGILASATTKASPTTSDLIPIADAAASNVTKKITIASLQTLLTPTQFTSTPHALSITDVGAFINTAHGLGSTPARVRAVMVCTHASGDAGYAQNDEVDVGQSAASANLLCFNVGANATNVFVVRNNQANNDVYQLFHKSTGNPTNLTTARWSIKVYAWL